MKTQSLVLSDYWRGSEREKIPSARRILASIHVYERNAIPNEPTQQDK